MTLNYQENMAYEADNGGDEDNILFFGGREAILEQGDYHFVVDSVRVERNRVSKYGLCDYVVLKYRITAPGGQVELTQKYPVSNSQSSRFGRLVKQMLELTIGSQLNANLLRGVTGTARITHYTHENGNVYANVEEVFDCKRPKETV